MPQLLRGTNTNNLLRMQSTTPVQNFRESHTTCASTRLTGGAGGVLGALGRHRRLHSQLQLLRQLHVLQQFKRRTVNYLNNMIVR